MTTLGWLLVFYSGYR